MNMMKNEHIFEDQLLQFFNYIIWYDIIIYNSIRYTYLNYIKVFLYINISQESKVFHT